MRNILYLSFLLIVIKPALSAKPSPKRPAPSPKKPVIQPKKPVILPSKPLQKPTQPKSTPKAPLMNPAKPTTSVPSRRPSKKPSKKPSRKPSKRPSKLPTVRKPSSRKPSKKPIRQPSRKPTKKPTKRGIFNKYLVIVLENQHYDNVMKDPYFKNISSNGTLFSNFFGITHPSYPNYLAMVGGDTFGVTSNTQVNLVNSSIADLLEKNNLTWKGYAGDYPGNCYLSSSNSNGTYTRKHVPFLSFQSIQTNATRCRNVVPASQFQADWNSRTLPNYSFYTPNMNDDGHDTSIAYSAQWLKNILEPLLSDEEGMNGTLIEVTYDEAFPVTGDNHIYTVLFGPMVQAGRNITTKYDHYDMLKTVEYNFNLGTLGRKDMTGKVISELWD
mmetsp:Transcript_24796/g.35563  ORF Transcript_24796/g.35563 Transcript_24796/m.35563 type:complete len:385 (-) Transcript_24796:200-1354(-)|eukprot:CAMPEP_0172432492 /NCGR_PEP_ID=MMETSP1064-20121228/63645_1 /TAXON_ID=202472 /ORGANISM="Aulacoseira subarctica , Strain CCAP 1002/5" /LENGTH=384 /DNA_ID=CAMNT_0013179849 /DNA_START=43 /DNA_END=1197 /DNA_ORIENTATION=-